MPNFWMSVKVRSYPMSHKMRADLQPMLMSYAALNNQKTSDLVKCFNSYKDEK